MPRIPCFPFLIVLTGAMLFLQCDLDHGLQVSDPTESVRHGIKGRIHFEGAWPPNVAEARLVVTSDFPPDPSEPLGSFVFSDPIQVGSASLNYGLDLNPDTYEIIAVITRERGQAWDIGNILAVYEPVSPCTIIPNLDQAVTVASSESVVEGVDIFVDLTKGNIRGTVEFMGNRPLDVTFAGILAFKFPLNLLDPVPCGLAILPLDATSANYKLLVPADSYVLLAVAGTDLADLSNFRTIGAYVENGNSQTPGIVEVAQSQDVSQIDLVVDWNAGAR